MGGSAGGAGGGRLFRAAFRKMVRELRTVAGSLAKGGRNKLPTLIISVMGAQEEMFFRGWLSRFAERCKRPVFAFLKRCGFDDQKTKERHVERIYMAINAVMSGILFGLVHLQNMSGKKGFLEKKAVLCQVVFTTVMGFVFTYLKRFTNLTTAWIGHFVHNAMAMQAV